jgi:hypothetical protein
MLGVVGGAQLKGFPMNFSRAQTTAQNDKGGITDARG